MLKVSVITPSNNSSKTILSTINSVLSQTYPYIEYIIIDNASTDGTRQIIESFGDKISKFISEPDNGIYCAMNKGIKLSTGDVVGILNSDDFFCNNNVIENVVKAFDSGFIDIVYGDIKFVSSLNFNKVIRYYSSKRFNINKFQYGFMPAHPSFYAKKEYFEKFGYYKEDYLIAADFELLIKFLYVNKLCSKYLNMPFVSMRTGGISTKSLESTNILNKEILRACKENGIKTNMMKIYLKYIVKIFEFIKR
jgi:glycosyltransferase involved in cell wall biosynthesis